MGPRSISVIAGTGIMPDRCGDIFPHSNFLEFASYHTHGRLGSREKDEIRQRARLSPNKPP
jgi:hypothetical protein